ncbi:hypothetical protein DFQ27_008480 [Actinomortierella ambigua]|uniref:NET domain-containing protein n=1 Tax=Actinomortierella ambigua TaxID=1343610 RepID=A0A9P6PQF7_9FUNG|nr:hypothetical protein DFQ27_008480 [Actinomortierella ambigua]
MGGITLVDSPADPERGGVPTYPSLLLKSNTAFATGPIAPLAGASDLALQQSFDHLISTDKLSVANDAVNMATGANNAGGSNGFSIADFLVPGLQTKTWDDWQSAVDDLSNQSDLAFGVQDFTSDLNAMALQTGFESLLGNTTVWQQADLQGLPMEQAYDELVFDLSSSSFEQPTTVNTADLIAGPNNMPAVSPLDLALRANTYQDLALANLYGFTEVDASSDSQHESDDLEEEDEDEDEEGDEEDGSDDDGSKQIAHLQDRQFQEDLNTAMAMSLAEANGTTLSSSSPRALSPATTTDPVTMVARPMLGRGDSNKRRMEEQLAARISNDLGPEHMAGLFKILKGGAGDEDEEEDEDEEVEFDLSSLDETKLVELYQYVESCCIQTMGTILAAHQDRERAAAAEKARIAREEEDRKVAAAAAAATAAAEAAYQEALMRRTPELSSSQTSSASSSNNSPSPVAQSPSKGRRSTTKRSSPSTSTSEFVYTYEEEEDSWGPSSIHCKRKRVTGQGAGVGGGGTGKGRRITSKASSPLSVSPSSSMMVAAVTAAVSAPLVAMAICEETMVVMSAEGEEDDEEIDVVGI